MKDINYHFSRIKPYPIIFDFPMTVHFGDKLTFINLVKNLNLSDYKINVNNKYSKELCSYFFEDSFLTEESPTHFFIADVDHLNETYKCKYFKIKGSEVSLEKKYITYSFDCITNKDHKPPYLEALLDHLKDKYGSEMIKPIGIKIEDGDSIIKNTLKYLFQSKVFIGMDNGMSHLCRMTDIPWVLLEYTNDVERTHPKEYCNRFVGKSIESISDYISSLT